MMETAILFKVTIYRRSCKIALTLMWVRGDGALRKKVQQYR